jgi:hypothetical protein
MWGMPVGSFLVKDSGPKVDTTVLPPDQFSSTTAQTVEIIGFGDPVAQPGSTAGQYSTYVGVTKDVEPCYRVEKEQDNTTTRPVLTGFEQNLRRLINAQCVDNLSNTPDFILAEYLSGCLNAFNYAVQRREQWFGRKVF